LPSSIVAGRIPRSILAIGLDPSLRGSLALRAAGRVLVIDEFRSWRCGTWIGDMTVEWRRAAPGDEFAELEAVDGIRLFAHRRLLRLLRLAGATLVRPWLSLFGGLAITLDRPELWIDYLDRPGSYEGALLDGAPAPDDPSATL
jgi:hypothetical protein